LLTTAAALPALPWHRALARRIATHTLVKIMGTTVGISVFFWIYFWVMHNPHSAPLLMPVTALDRWFEVRSLALPLYGSLWLYVALPGAFAKDKAELYGLARASALMSGLGLAFFWLVPTATPPFAVDWNAHPALQFLKTADAAGNAFPSLHVSFAVFSAIVLARQLRTVGAPRAALLVNGLWCWGIVYSTLAVRQHVLVDVLGGVALGAWVAWAFGFVATRRPSLPPSAPAYRSPR
jgi:membrane-associated phospholipid phosphatase